MAIKKSALYSSLWKSCDELRGGMDASQYKDYILSFLFIKYISDKYAGIPYPPIIIPDGAYFSDMVALKGSKDIGDDINKKIIAPLVAANDKLDQSYFPDFADPAKLGNDKEMVERLTKLVAIFQNPALDFSKNRADGDDILGDAYEYLMRHFATESGKSKGQFYTPAEVSRVMSQILGLRRKGTTPRTSAYDPTCGSGSLLLKVADEAPTKITLYGQERDVSTAGLAQMNVILHDQAEAQIEKGNTLTDPRFKDGEGVLKRFDYVVANPPFSDKAWSAGLDNPAKDKYERFALGVPPTKQGDYAYLLHIVASLKTTGTGACILPHGVLFRGNAEAEIRRKLVQKGYIKGIIGLPPNLFYGTGIPACIIVLDKEQAHERQSILMVDASHGYIKDGPKNRLRERDIHQIVDVFNNELEIPYYSRKVELEEIERHEFNLNLPRYIEARPTEDPQDIAAHLQGGIPQRDVDALHPYWKVCPRLRHTLFAPLRRGYVALAVPKGELKQTILQHPEFMEFTECANQLFYTWTERNLPLLRGLGVGDAPKDFIARLGEDLLAHYTNQPLLDPYTVYQHLLDYWAETMRDDCDLITADGWLARPERIIEKNKQDKEVGKGWKCDLLPKPYIVAAYFPAAQAQLDELAAQLENITAELSDLEEEQSGEEGALADLDKVNKAAVTAKLKELKSTPDTAEEQAVLAHWLVLTEQQSRLKKVLKEGEADLDGRVYAHYETLTEQDTNALVVRGKWLPALTSRLQGEVAQVSQTLTGRVQELAERYETPLPQLVGRVAELEGQVNKHLQRMGFTWA